MTDPFGVTNGNSAKDVKEFHINDDVDSANAAHHHTLGKGLFQAAPGADYDKFKNETLATLANQDFINSSLDARLVEVEYRPYVLLQATNTNVTSTTTVDITGLSHTIDTTGGPAQVWEYTCSLDVEHLTGAGIVFVGFLNYNGVNEPNQVVFYSSVMNVRVPLSQSWFITYPANTAARTSKMRAALTGAGSYQVNSTHSTLKGRRII